MKTEPPLLLALDQRNLAHFLSALALAALAQRIEGADRQSRTCWWEGEEHFGIQSGHPSETFRSLLFDQAFTFLKDMEWQCGLGGVAHGILVRRDELGGDELGVNPFITLTGDANENTPLKGFSARVVPRTILRQQVGKLKARTSCDDWLHQLDRGVSSWGFDWRVNAHASDAGISSDAEGTGDYDPFYPAVELLSLAAAAFFVPCHAWQATKNALHATAWTRPIPLSMASFAATGCIHGLASRLYAFTWRGAAHGKGSAYHFFPPATLTN